MVGFLLIHDLETGPIVFYNSPDLIGIVLAAMYCANLSILFIRVNVTKTTI